MQLARLAWLPPLALTSGAATVNGVPVSSVAMAFNCHPPIARPATPPLLRTTAALADGHIPSCVGHETMGHVKGRIAALQAIVVRVGGRGAARQIVHVVREIVAPRIADPVGNTLRETLAQRHQQAVVVRAAVVGGQFKKGMIAARNGFSVVLRLAYGKSVIGAPAGVKPVTNPGWHCAGGSLCGQSCRRRKDRARC